MDDFITGLFDKQYSDSPTDSVKFMADNFRLLVDQYNPMMQFNNQPLVVLVDDLDRCMPDHQIAILESIHFLTSAQANCHFVIAIDPQLVSQAAITHYKVTSFDTEQFLDKLFDLRISLRYLRSESTLPLFKRLLEISDVDGESTSRMLLEVFPNVFMVPVLNNPRILTRIARRTKLFMAQSQANDWLSSSNKAFAFLTWAAVCERWSSLRIVFQTLNSKTIRGGLLADLMNAIIENYRDPFSENMAPRGSGESKDFSNFVDPIKPLKSGNPEEPGSLKKSGNPMAHKSPETTEIPRNVLWKYHRPIAQRLPAQDREPDLGNFLSLVISQARDMGDGSEEWLFEEWARLDTEMCNVAL